MKKLLILLSVLILVLSITTVSAGLVDDFLGHPTAECKLFKIDIPDNYSTSDGYDPFGETGFYVVDWNNADEPNRTLHIWEVTSFDDFNRSETEEIIKSYSEGDIKAEACYDPEESTVVDQDIVYGANYTHIEFSKDGHYYVIENDFDGKYTDIDLKKDVEIAKQVKESLKRK